MAVAVVAIGIKVSMVPPRKLHPHLLQAPVATVLPVILAPCHHSTRTLSLADTSPCKTAVAVAVAAVAPTALQQVGALASIKKEAHRQPPSAEKKAAAAAAATLAPLAAALTPLPPNKT